MVMKKVLARCFGLFAVATMCVAADAPGFKVTKKYVVPGNGGFDYIVFDGSSNRLYVSHGTEVDVLDADSGAVLGTVEDTPGVHGTAIVPSLHRGFTTNGGNATVSVFDTNTFSDLEPRVKLGRGTEIATIRPGTPVPRLVFIGRAINVAPVAGTRSRFATFSRLQIPAADSIRWAMKSCDRIKPAPCAYAKYAIYDHRMGGRY
jgi:hypothetical protein